MSGPFSGFWATSSCAPPCSTSTSYVHVLEQSGDGVTSPLDTLPEDPT
ncbi:hypothetical protein [Salinibacter ruber]|nr:hypothetical protein [Salinibacter ruber]